MRLTSTRNSIITCFLASLTISVPTLIFLKTTLRFTAYAILFLTVFSALLIMNQLDLLRRRWLIPKAWVFVIIDGAFLAFSIVLLLSLNFCVIDQFLRSIMGLLMIFFMPGYLFLRLLKLPRKNSPISEILIFSLPYSALLMAFVGLLIAKIQNDRMVAICFLALSLVASVVMLAFDLRSKAKLVNEVALSDLIAISVSTLVFFSMFFINYPRVTRIPAADIVEHLREAISWLRSPYAYVIYEVSFPGFHFPEAIAYLISGYPDPGAFLTATALLSFMLFPSFYLLAKAVFRSEDERLAPLSLLLLSCLSGFGWLFILLKWRFGDLQSYIMVQQQAFEKTYQDLPQGGAIDLYAWFRTRTMGFIAFFLISWTLIEPSLSRREKILNLALLSACLFLIHASEFLVFIIALTLLILFDEEFRGEFKDLLLAQAVFYGVMGSFSLLAFTLDQLSLLTRMPFILLLMVLLIMLAAYILSPFAQALWRWIRSKLPEGSGLLILLITLVFIFSGVMAWLDQVDTFSMNSVSRSEIGFLPWFFYPVHLGMAFILACIGLWSKPIDVRDRGLKMALSVIVLTFLIGRLISISNLYIIYTGFMEWRMPRYAFVASCLIAPLGFRYLWDRMKPKKLNLKKLFMTCLSIGALILIGSMGTFYSMEMSDIILSQAKPFGPGDEEAVKHLRELIWASPYTCVLTYTDISANIIRYAFPETIIEWRRRYVIWASNSPELALSLLYDALVNEFNGLYALYVHYRDLRLVQDFVSSYMNYLISVSEPYYSNEYVSIFILPSFIPPTEGAPMVLLTPINSSQAFEAYSILSFGHYYYETALDMDPTAFSKQIVVLPMDYVPPILEILNLTNWLEAGGNLLVLSHRGLGPLSSYFLSTPSISLWAPDWDVQISTPFSGEPSTGLNLTGDVVEFSLENPWDENSPEVLADDGQSSFWVPKAYGKGSIGVPVLHDDENVKASGENAIRIEVGEGDKAQWLIVHEYEEPQDWSDFDFLSFYWYGRGDGLEYVVWINAPDVDNKLWFSFIDTWEGWRRIILPLRGLDGLYSINGVNIRKITSGSPDLGNITYISIRLSAANLNVKGTWRLDRLMLDLGRWADIEGTLDVRGVSRPLISLEVFNGTDFVKAFSSSGNITIQLMSDDVSYGGLPGRVLFGPGVPVLEASLSVRPPSYRLGISLKLPPKPISKTRLRLAITSEGLRVRKVVIQDHEFSLPEEVEVMSLGLREGVDVLGWYEGVGGRRPFVMVREVGAGSITYVDLRPIFSAFGQSHLFSALLTVADLLRPLGLPVLKALDKPPVSLEQAVFSSLRAEGDIVLTSYQLVFLPGDGPLDITLRFPNGSSRQLRACYLAVEGSEPVGVRLKELEALGKGFYMSVATRGEVVVEGEHVSSIVIKEHSSGRYTILGGRVELAVSGELILILAREAHLTLAGRAIMEDVYVCTWLEKRILTILEGLSKGYMPGSVLRVRGKDVEIEGSLSLDFYVGGGPLASDIAYYGEVSIKPPPITWDDAGSLLRALPFFILSSVILALGYLLGRASRPEEGGLGGGH